MEKTCSGQIQSRSYSFSIKQELKKNLHSLRVLCSSIQHRGTVDKTSTLEFQERASANGENAVTIQAAT